MLADGRLPSTMPATTARTTMTDALRESALATVDQSSPGAGAMPK